MNLPRPRWPLDHDDSVLVVRWGLLGGAVLAGAMLVAVAIGVAWRLFLLVSGIGSP